MTKSFRGYSKCTPMDYLRSVGVNDDEIVSRLLQMHSNDSDSTSTISSTAVDAAFRAGKGGVAIDKKLVDSIWKMIAAKTLTTTSSVKKFDLENDRCEDADYYIQC
ncbi:hypothetical protein QE152_g6329 [Popillia japonica]|uniref:Uncharacterized protein n=1 Tax=Popillia japonica TaxID=7064 RepID=A0AAW1MHL9_POPJA